MNAITPMNVLPDPEMVDWIKKHSLGNVSAVIRAAIWALMLHPDPDGVIRTYIQKPLTPREIKSYEERYRQEILKGGKRKSSRTG